MIRVLTNDGARFEGATVNHVVRAMANAQWNAPERKVEYKREVVHRVMLMTGQSLSQSALRDARRFLRFLQRAGLLTIEWETSECLTS